MGQAGPQDWNTLEGGVLPHEFLPHGSHAHVTFDELLPSPTAASDDEALAEFPEAHDVLALERHRSQPHRRDHVMIAVDTSSNSDKTAKRPGRQNTSTHHQHWRAVPGNGTEYRLHREDPRRLSNLLQTSPQVEAMLPGRKRLHISKKQQSSSALVDHKVKCTDRLGEGRRFVAGVGAQVLPRRIQANLLPGTSDLDMANAILALTDQIIQKLRLVDTDIWSEVCSDDAARPQGAGYSVGVGAGRVSRLGQS